MSIHLHQNADQQHDDGASDRDADAFQALEPRADAVIPQCAHLFVRVEPGFSLVDGRHGAVLV